MYDIRIFGILIFFILLIDIPFVITIFKPYLWNKVLKKIQGSSDNDNKLNILLGFIITYILIPLGIFLFVIPLIDKNDWFNSCLKWGFIWGLITYGIFDFTNLVLFKDYPLSLAIVDTLWGGIMCATSLLITYTISIKIGLISIPENKL